ncbi:MAG: mandelate racemase/muconate lactonizing enzyme family protein [Candidatus Hydrogenedentes bacterium]|nr:mandelate racemase/muconate lactonizing enzyme family protein [Candidatus Hydrogenedentota bacterium]
MKTTDIRVRSAALYFLPVTMRVPLKFGAETLTSITCARVRVVVEDQSGATADGWGETPLSVGWVWPSALPYDQRHEALKTFCTYLAKAWAHYSESGHPIEIGNAFEEDMLRSQLDTFNHERAGREPMPWLAALVCSSPFDLAMHDAYGNLLQRPTYETYTAEFMNHDLAHWLRPADGSEVSFAGKYPCDYLQQPARAVLPAWHLVGGKDPIDASELDGSEPRDGYPVLLSDWITRDGLTCLKIKLRGNDSEWDYARTVKVGQTAEARQVRWLSVDFNCTVHDPEYVTAILDRLMLEQPAIYGTILYVEQPFPYDLEKHQIDVHSVSARKPLFMDESAHDWHMIRLGRSLGWSGVALKTCKTQTGALQSLCWAKAHGMTLMVQDLTNPMLAQIPHVLLAAHAGTIMGVETNSMQFYPEASKAEAAVHAGLYQRRNGALDLSSIRGAGFGYRISEIKRVLPEPVVVCE